MGVTNSMCYKQDLFAQKTPYLQWLKEQEQQLAQLEALGKQMHTLPFSSCMDMLPNADNIERACIYLFVKTGGELSKYANTLIQKTFLEQKDTVFVYADEDYRGSLKELYGIEDGLFDEEMTAPYRFGDPKYYRGNPWFKPDFSPDTLVSFFYIGSIFAVRGDTLAEVVNEYGKDISLYELVYRIFMCELQKKQHGIIHVPRVLYTNHDLSEETRLETSDRIKEIFASETFFDRQKDDDQCVKDKVSIIIPSKDNAQVLRKCLDTLTMYTEYKNYELILVDNGSSPEQRMCISHMIEELRATNAGKHTPFEITYLYEEMDFNFSRMCNLGAKSAKGSYLLFLNDDIEIMNTEEGRKWLEYMLSYAAKHHVGAVGAKLYYPEPEDGKYRIQHAGITNMGIGPAHKLGGMIDSGCLYHGHNIKNYDMLAVTGACLLVKRSAFEELGCFDEELAVAYNDVELCFRLYRAGFFNVQVNDAVLVHHESLSRGTDTSQEKQSRLKAEKQRLYEKHPVLRNKDPFYSPNLVQWKKDVEYNTGYLYECDKLVKPRLLDDDEKRVLFKKYDFRRILDSKCKAIRKIYDRMEKYHLLQCSIDDVAETDELITITGWYLELDRDNAGLPKKLWLIDETRNENFRNVYEFDIPPKLREDVEAVFADSVYNERTKNTALSGIQLSFEKAQLQQGSYRIGILTDKKRLICVEQQITQTDNRQAWVKISDTQKGVI